MKFYIENSYHCIYFLLFYFFIFFISWRLITLQYCSGFCHTLTWISHGYTCISHPDPPSPYFYVFFGEISTEVLCHFKNQDIWELLLFVIIVSLDINSLSDICLSNILSYSAGFHFILLITSFAMEKFIVWHNPTCLFLLLISMSRAFYLFLVQNLWLRVSHFFTEFFSLIFITYCHTLTHTYL